MWQVAAANGTVSATNVLNVDAGNVLLTNVTTGDMNATAINV
ncbi:MAG: hypothetical protein JWO31_2166 [Phycisphaerales bacterium]|nr:hypothetical protein [Phycisphaerales bacterium]